MSNRTIFVDTTLRDGEQTAGVVFAKREKIQIAKMLDQLGVDQLEVGIPVMGGEEQEAIKEIDQMWR
jgi:homocitrate synthase NifV